MNFEKMPTTYHEVCSELKKEINPKKIRRLLREFGVFPPECRSVLWRYMLDVPNNTTCFRKIIRDALDVELPCIWSSVTETKAQRTAVIQTSFERLLKWLMVWSPELASIKFIPELVLPFVKLFYAEPNNCFEISATIIGSLSRVWLEMQPLPPFNLMGMIEQLVYEYAPGALKIFKHASINVTTYAWTLMETGFAEALYFDQWMTLWDHLICNTFSLTVSACIAYVCVTEASLRELSNSDHGNLKEFYSLPRSVDMRHFLKRAYEIMDNVTNWPLYLQKPYTALGGPSDSSFKQLCVFS